MTDEASFGHLLGTCREARDAAGFPGHLPTGERLAAARVPNRTDWLAEKRYPIVEANERIGPVRASSLPHAVLPLEEDHRARPATLRADDSEPVGRNGVAAD